MKRGLVIGALLAATLLGSGSTAFAGDRWSFGFGVGSGGFHVGGGYSRGHYPHPRRVHRHVHHHVRVPVYVREWVPPVHEIVCVGRDHCGRPIYREVCVRRGYYRSVVSAYRCNSCGVGC